MATRFALGINILADVGHVRAQGWNKTGECEYLAPKLCTQTNTWIRINIKIKLSSIPI